HQVRPAVIVEIRPECIAYHPYIRQGRRHLRRYIREMDMAVLRIISIDAAGNRPRIMPGIHPTGDEEVEVTVVVQVYSPYTGFAGQIAGQGCRIPGEVA